MAAPVKAIEGMVFEKTPGLGVDGRPDGRDKYRITAGTPSWAGKSIEICEAEINDIGIVPFLRECQHDTAVGGRFFADWDEKRNVIFEDQAGRQPHWTAIGGYDWGLGAPCCFLLAFVDDRGRIVIADEVYERGLTDPEQAQAVVDCIKRWGVPLDRVAIWADPSMWAMKMDHAGKRIANVEAFHRAGLRFIKASNDRQGGWQNVRRYIKEAVDKVPTLRVLRGRCSNLIRIIPLQVFDSTDVEDLDTDGEDHAVDALRYLLSGRPLASAPPKAPEPGDPLPPGTPDHRPAWLKAKSSERKRKL